MIAGLAAQLHRLEPTGAPELAAALERVLDAAGTRVRCEGGETLRPGHVERLRFALEHGAEAARPGSLVVKRLSLDRAHREQRAVRHWLPSVGLGAHGAPLLAVAAAPDAARVWHVYADLGDETLARVAAAAGPVRAETLQAALGLVAALHLRFASEPLLADCRLAGLELGAGFFAASLGDALRGLGALRRTAGLPPERRPLVDRLRERLAILDGEREARTRELSALGWPETLLHGDLWLSNVLLEPGAGRPHLRLIDWDRAGIGSALYDLSTLLRQLPAADRPGLLAAYRECVERAGWPWPSPALLERVAETCELGRFASCLVWRMLAALELSRGGARLPDWLFDDLAEGERWFAERTPLLSEATGAYAA